MCWRLSSAVHSTCHLVCSTPTYDVVQQVGCSQLRLAVGNEQVRMQSNVFLIEIL
jgi:hypothetical protein